MPTPDDDHDDRLLARLYESGADSDDGELAGEVESYRRIRGAIADYARATEVEPPRRGLDELMAAARSRAPARTAVAPEPPGFWARLRAWLQPIVAHPALASAAMVIVVAGVAGVLYVKGRVDPAVPEAAPSATVDYEPAGRAAGPAPVAPETDKETEHGLLVQLDDGDATAPNEAPAKDDSAEPGSELHYKHDGKTGKNTGTGTTISLGGTVDKAGQGGGKVTTGTEERSGDGKPGVREVLESVGVGNGVVVTDDRNDKVAPAQDPVVQTPPSTNQQQKPPGRTQKPAQKPTQPSPPTTAPATSGAPAVDETDAYGGDAADAVKPTGRKNVDVGQLTRQARTAARSGDCGVVRAIGGKVRAADAAYYKKTFATDADIKKCL